MKRLFRRKIRTERTVRAYAVLHTASWHALEQANNTESGRFYNCMTSMLFSAFCLEAFFNHVCEGEIDHWQMVERCLRPDEKLDLLSTLFGYPIDHGRRPFQTFGSIFKFRNLVAHARTERLGTEYEEVLAELEWPTEPEMPQTKWEKVCNLDMAQRFVDDTKEMLVILGEKAGLEPGHLYLPGTFGWETSTRANR
jgi:hypothetical protein